MAAKFVSASSQRLVQTPTPITAMPFSVGYWVFVGAQASQAQWGIFDAAGTANFYRFIHTSTGFWQIAAGDGTTAFQNFGTITVGKWHYVVVRFIDATNKRAAVLRPDGAVDHGTTATSVTPTSLDNMSLGSLEGSVPSNFLDGSIAEFWCAGIDVQGDGAQMQESLLRQIAYGGPFSLPHIANTLIEYRSLRVHPTLGPGYEIYSGGGQSLQTLSNTNGVTIGPHPPLPYWSANPGQRRSELVI